MCYPKVHAIIEHIKSQMDFCFDTLDVLESTQNILDHYSIYVTFTDEELKVLKEELMKLADLFQTQEIVRLYIKDKDSLSVRWLD